MACQRFVCSGWHCCRVRKPGCACACSDLPIRHPAQGIAGHRQSPLSRLRRKPWPPGHSPRTATRGVERQEVLWRRSRQRVVRVRCDAGQPSRSGRHDASDFGVEALAPVVRLLGVRRVDPPQVVNHVAAAQHEHPRVTQRRQLAPEVQVVLRPLPRVQGQLQDRHARVGKHVRQDRPGAMVEPPAVVVETHVGRLHEVRDFQRHIRGAG